MWQDHPRSRGVYTSTNCARAWPRGSSPLARGLRAWVRTDRGIDGIIPARAGFTSRTIGRWPASWDHPRSRGVYGLAYGIRLLSQGSSPLARGLPHSDGGHGVSSGIIPARAGFTAEEAHHEHHREDHPRSRGVYTSRALTAPQPAGSSPLARGLHLTRPHRPTAGRIIPARAGFTPSRPGRRRWGRDHPRSRGVYAGSRCGRWRSSGSSPLARGLPVTIRQIEIAGGIIPARAGFTRRS